MKVNGIKITLKESLLYLTSLVLVGLLRLYNLNELPVFADEAIYIRWSQIMRVETSLRFLPLSDGKQPLFMWMTIPFLKLFTDPLIAGRVLSALCGIATAVGISLAVYLLFKSKYLAILASFFYAISPYSLFFDRMALADSMLTMFGIWFFVFSIITAKTLRLDIAMITGFILGGALLTKSTALYYVLLLPTTLFFADVGKKTKKKVFRLIPLWLIILFIGYGMYNILRLGPNFHMLAIRNLDYVYPLRHVLQSPFDPLISHLNAYINFITLLGPWILIFLFFGGLFVGLKNYKKETIILCIWILVPVFSVLIYSKVLTARYLLFVVPYILIISVVNFLNNSSLYKKIFTVICAIYVLQSLYFNFLIINDVQNAKLPKSERSGYLEEWSAGGGIKEASEYLRSEYGNGKAVVVGTEGYFGTLPDGLQIYLNNYPNFNVIGIGLDLKEVPKSLIDSAKSGNETYLLINSTRLAINDPEKNNLKLVSKYVKPKRAVGTKEYNLFGPNEILYLFKVNP